MGTRRRKGSRGNSRVCGLPLAGHYTTNGEKATWAAGCKGFGIHGALPQRAKGRVLLPLPPLLRNAVKNRTRLRQSLRVSFIEEGPALAANGATRRSPPPKSLIKKRPYPRPEKPGDAPKVLFKLCGVAVLQRAAGLCPPRKMQSHRLNKWKKAAGKNGFFKRRFMKRIKMLAGKDAKKAKIIKKD